MKLILANPPRSSRRRRRRHRRARRNPGVSSVKRSIRRRFAGLGSIGSVKAYLNKGTIKDAAFGAAATIAVPMLLSKVGVLQKVKSPVAKVLVTAGAMIGIAAVAKKAVGESGAKAIALSGLTVACIGLYNNFAKKKAGLSGYEEISGYDDLTGYEDMAGYDDIAGYLEGPEDDLGDDDLGDDELGDDELGDDELGDDVLEGEYEVVG